MYLSGRITVTAVIPEKLARLKDLAYNLWWSWNSEAIDLFREIDLPLWERLGKNPVRFIQEVSQKKLDQKINDMSYMKRYDETVQRFDAYLGEKDTWFDRTYPIKKKHRVAYFSAEYGLNEVLPVYSGGLGVLSGDHCKSASDLGLPFTAIGLFYKQGYFIQRINRDGWQETDYKNLNISYLPVRPVLDANGEKLLISLELPGRVVYAAIWLVKVGRISLYLIDTDIAKNSEQDRQITSRLYGGDQETRIQQEIFLGVGGVKVLDALGLNATVYHMNEGHSAFLGLELIRRLMNDKGLGFRQAREVVSSSVIFTTHTPVPAGNDVFPVQMIDRYFSSLWASLGISRHEFLDLGLKVSDSQNFNMTVLALSLAGRKNGVSELHGAVTRNIFNSIWPGFPEDEVPVTHVTNGIHTLTWLSPNYKYLYDKYLEADWKERLYEKSVWDGVDGIPDEELWKIHCALKTKMIGFVRDRLRTQRMYNNEPVEVIKATDGMLDPDALTLGFARRFATYKRANLIFRNIDRIKRILNRPDAPVQIVFAGKAHPADRPAQEVMKNIYDISRQEGFYGKVILVENYNMTLARNLVQGVDIWLNNPRRPLEASGTSGQKVCINGVINFSILDGWWCEGYNGKNGWAIGDDTYFESEYSQDNADSESVYDILEKQIIPMFYERDEKGVPVKWVKTMKESVKSLTYKFSTHRMLQEYTDRMYLPSMERVERFTSGNYKAAADLVDWKANLEKSWPQVQISENKAVSIQRDGKISAGEVLSLGATVMLGSINPADVKVELYYGRLESGNLLDNTETAEMSIAEKISEGVYRYSVGLKLSEGGEYGYTFRIIPCNPDLINASDMALIRWVIQ